MSTRVVRIDGCDPIRLTRAMIRGLRVVHEAFHPRRSNVTSENRQLVYWQAVDQLVDAGLVEIRGHPTGNHRLRCTPLGTRVVYALEDRP